MQDVRCVANDNWGEATAISFCHFFFVFLFFTISSDLKAWLARSSYTFVLPFSFHFIRWGVTKHLRMYTLMRQDALLFGHTASCIFSKSG